VRLLKALPRIEAVHAVLHDCDAASKSATRGRDLLYHQDLGWTLGEDDLATKFRDVITTLGVAPRYLEGTAVQQRATRHGCSRSVTRAYAGREWVRSRHSTEPKVPLDAR
jgi:hypothetical protein